MDFLAQTTITTTTTEVDTGSLAVFSGAFMFVWLAVMVVVIAGMWTTFAKAGKPGWGSIIPIYNTILMLEIAGKPVWWVLLYFIPVVNLIVMIITFLAIGEKFGKSTLFSVLGLILFTPIGFLILGFGDAEYNSGDSPAATPAMQ